MKWGKVYVNDEFESLQKWRYYRKLTPYEKFVVAQTQIFFQKMGQVPVFLIIHVSGKSF